MKRRVIRTRGRSLVLEQLQAKRNQIAESIASQLEGLSQQQINIVTEKIRASGWDSASFDSTSRQMANSYRPEVQAFLFHHEHVLDELAVGQAVYTEFMDTAADPNFAIRFPAETELILRRMTAGDLYLLQAAQHMHFFLGAADKPSEENELYWEMLWTQILNLFCTGVADHIAAVLTTNPVAAFFMTERHARFANRAMMGSVLGAEPDEADAQFKLAFFHEQSARYLGIKYTEDRVRVGDRFENHVLLIHADSDQHLWRAACILFAFGIDMRLRAMSENETKMPFQKRHYNLFTDFAQDHLRFYVNNVKDVRNVDQETQQPTAGDTSEPGSDGLGV